MRVGTTPYGCWKVGYAPPRMRRQRSGWPSRLRWPTAPLTTASGTLPAGTCMMSSTASRATTRPAGLIRSWPSPSAIPSSRLLTPVGLRSLAPDHPDYKARYDGDLRARDAAYHQGTVWAWLIGPFIDAWLKVYPDDHAGAQRLLHSFEAHVSKACIDSISEIFDAEFTTVRIFSPKW